MPPSAERLISSKKTPHSVRGISCPGLAASTVIFTGALAKLTKDVSARVSGKRSLILVNVMLLVLQSGQAHTFRITDKSPHRTVCSAINCRRHPPQFLIPWEAVLRKPVSYLAVQFPKPALYRSWMN